MGVQKIVFNGGDQLEQQLEDVVILDSVKSGPRATFLFEHTVPYQPSDSVKGNVPAENLRMYEALGMHKAFGVAVAYERAETSLTRGEKVTQHGEIQIHSGVEVISSSVYDRTVAQTLFDSCRR